MAMTILGKSSCGLCGRLLLRGEGIASFPPFVSNEADPLHFFSDRAFHEDCFAADPRASSARHRFDELRTRTAPGCRICTVCSEEIRDPDDYLSFGFVADQPPRVACLNHLQFHRQHLPRWPGLSAGRAALLELETSGAWKGPALRWLIEQLEKALAITTS